MLKTGQTIPSFETIDQNGKTHKSSEWANQKIILYFYPKDDTPGCTKQACNIRDNFDNISQEGYKVFGISPDGENRHQKFITKYDLPFDLLVDEDHKIAELFGTWGEKSMYGKKYMGILRTSFIIENGVITKVIEKVKTGEHTKQLLEG